MTINPVGLKGIAFAEFCSKDSDWLHTLFQSFGFSRMAQTDSECDLYTQNDIHFFVNHKKDSFSADFEQKHGPCLSSMGWLVENAEEAQKVAVERGASPATHHDFFKDGKPVPAILGIGGSIIYFVESSSTASLFKDFGFKPLEKPDMVEAKGFLRIDHMTNNVERGQMEKWSNFYKDIFAFTEIRYFDIKGAKTGLISYALASPDGSFCIPINEGTEAKSQINEYLREYNGPGVQHIALLTDNILDSLDRLEGTPIDTLDIDDQYYSEVYDRVPNVTEDRDHIRRHNVLVDGDEKGYLLQIFTKNVIGPIFIEMIQRKNNNAFGEGNFGALFRAIERDQEKRGVL